MLAYEKINLRSINDVNLEIIADRIRNKYIKKIKEDLMRQNLLH